jgi:hypothetical protein
MPLPLIVGAVTLTSGLWKWATAEPDYEAGANAALDSAGAPERAVGCAFSDSTECAAVLDIVGAVMAADAATAWAAGATDDGGATGGTARDDAVTAAVGLMSPRGSAAPAAAAAAAAAAVFDPAASPGWRSLGLTGSEGGMGQAGGGPGGGGAALTDAACEIGWALASDLLARAKKAGRAVVLVAGARPGDRKRNPGESNGGGAAGGEGEGGTAACAAAEVAAARARMSGVLLLQRLAPGVAPTSHAGVHAARDAAAAVRARGPATVARMAHVAAVRARLHGAAPRAPQSHCAGGVAAAAAAAAAPRARFHIIAVAPSIGGVPLPAARQWAAWRRRGPSGPSGLEGDDDDDDDEVARRAFESSPRALRARDEDANDTVDQLLKAAVALADAAGAELLCESSAPHRLLPLLLRHSFTVRNELPLTGACIAAAPGARAAALNLLGLAREPRRPSLPPRARQQGPDGSHAEPGPTKPAGFRAEQEEPVRATTPPPPPAAAAAAAAAAAPVEMAAGAPASDEDIDDGGEAAEEDVVLHSEADPVFGADGSGAAQGGSAALIANAADPVVACAADGATANAANGGKPGVAVPAEPGSSDGKYHLADDSEGGGGNGKDGGDGHVEDEDEEDDDGDSESSNDDDEDDDEDNGVVLVSESALQTVAVAATTDVHAV